VSSPSGRRGATPARGPRRALLAVLAALLGSAPSLGCRDRSTQDTADVESSLAAIVATCAVVVGDVAVRRAGKEGWSPVTTGAVLRDGDTIRTGARAFVRVAFVSGNGIELEEQSSAVVDLARALETASAAPAGERVMLASGVAHGYFAEGPPAGAAAMRIRTGVHEDARLAPVAGKGAVRFRLTLTGGGTEIGVFGGEARVEAGPGRVSLAAGRAVELGAEGVGAPVELIDFPPSLRPGVDARFLLSPPLRVALAWQPLLAAPPPRAGAAG
jgi:hypothetical protein